MKTIFALVVALLCGLAGAQPTGFTLTQRNTFPNASNTGVPAGTTLTAYTGSCTITTNNTTIDSRTITCSPLLISAQNVTITKSRINGYVGIRSTEGQYTGGSNLNSLTISDSEIVGPTSFDNNGATGLGEMHWYATRIQITGFRRSAHCLRECSLENSYVYQNGTPLPGSTVEPNAVHASALRVGPNMLVKGNTIHCSMADVQDAGCSSNLTMYGEYGTMHDVTVEGNYFPASYAGYCTYAGNTHGRTDAYNIKFINNVFGRRGQGNSIPASQNTVNGASTCGYYGSNTSYLSNSGNEWTGNVYFPDGNTVSPD